MLDDLNSLRLTSASTSTGASKSMYDGVYGDGARDPWHVVPPTLVEFRCFNGQSVQSINAGLFVQISV